VTDEPVLCIPGVWRRV